MPKEKEYLLQMFCQFHKTPWIIDMGFQMDAQKIGFNINLKSFFTQPNISGMLSSPFVDHVPFIRG